MANYRLPGPMCSWSQNLVVDDGTSALSPGCRPGPIDGAVPGHASELDPRTLWRRASAVQEACRIGMLRAPEAIVRATGLDDLPALAKGIVEGALAMLAAVGAAGLLGGAAGAVVGAVFGGVGAVPAAAVGAQLGVDAGIAVLGWLGLGFLAVAIARGLMDVSGKVRIAVGRAWDAEGRSRRSEEVEAAGQTLADAIGQLMLLIVMAVVARLAAAQAIGAAAKASGTIEEMYAALRQSRLGAGFADWVQANEQRLLDNPRLRLHNVVGGTGGKSSETLTPSQLKQLREAPPAAAPVPQPRSGGSGSPAIRTDISKGSGTVWDSIKPTQEVWPGTSVPKSFELTAGNSRIWVHGNATEHLAEYATSMANRGVSTDLVNIGTQTQLRSLQSAIEIATENGMDYNKIVTVGGWELKFMPPRVEGQLPALIHALPVP